MEKTAAKTVKLKQIAERAIKDPDFWRQLRADPDAALLRNRMALGAEDYARLTGILGLHGRTVEVDLDRFMDSVRGTPRPTDIGDGLSWLAIWPDDIIDPARGRTRKR